VAHKKGMGSSKNGRDSNPQFLGVKIFAGQDVRAGQIIVRQRGTRFRPGPGTSIGKDDSIFAVRDGVAEFRRSGDRRTIAVVDAATGRFAVDTVISRVTMTAFSDAAIDAYVAGGEPLDKAGAYAIQGVGGALVAGLEGSRSNVIGLPLAATAALLGRFGVAVSVPRTEV